MESLKTNTRQDSEFSRMCHIKNRYRKIKGKNEKSNHKSKIQDLWQDK